MKVICRENTCDCNPLLLPVNNKFSISNDNFIVSKEWYTINAIESGYSLTIAKEYDVFGVIIYEGFVRFLMFDDDGMPGFFPSMLFSLINQEVFFDWEIAEYSVENKCLFYVGYPYLTQSYSNLVDLINCSCGAIEKILAYKEFMNLYSETNFSCP